VNWLFYFLLSAVFVFLGLTVHVFKWYFLIAGYNMMPKEQKANVDVEGLGKLMGFWGYINGAALFLIGLITSFNVEKGVIPWLIFFTFTTIYLLVKAQRFNHNPKGVASSRRQKGTVLSTIIILVFVGGLMLYSAQPTTVTINQDGVKIHGLYGQVYPWESITEVELLQELPGIARRTSGSAVGPYLRGRFRTTDSESIKLFVNRNQPPFIRLESNDGVVIFNLKKSADTEAALEIINSQI